MVKKRKRSSDSTDSMDAPSPGEIEADLLEFLSEIEGEIEIDENALEDGLRDTVAMYMRVAQRAAVEQSRRDSARQWFKSIDAKVDQRIRRAAKEEGEKVTEKEVESRKVLDQDYQEAFKTQLSIERGCKEVDALERTLSLRMSALRHLGDLWIAGYYGERVVTSQETKEKNARAQKTKEAVKQRSR